MKRKEKRSEKYNVSNREAKNRGKKEKRYTTRRTQDIRPRESAVKGESKGV